MRDSTTHTGQELKDVELRQAEQLGKLDAIASDIRDLDLAVTSLRKLLDSLGEVFNGFGQLLDSPILRSNPGTIGATGGLSCGTGRVKVSHDSSPSVDGTSTATVGDGQVAGVDTAAPATDATWQRLADQLRDALNAETETRRLLHATQRTQARAAKHHEDAQRAVMVAQNEISKHVIGVQA